MERLPFIRIIHRVVSIILFCLLTIINNHRANLAMYLTFAIAILAYWLMEGYHIFRRYQLTWAFILIINFFIFIVLLNSKAGMLALLIVIIIFTLSLIALKHNWLFGMAHSS